MITKTLFAVAALVVMIAPAHACVGATCDGIKSNGVSLNGIGLNGIGLNGVGLNGVGLNGVGLNGVGLNGVQLKGSEPLQPSVKIGGHEGGTLNGTVVAIEF
jgi:hypothetical protein